MHLHLDASAATDAGPEQFRVGSIQHYSLRVCSARDRDACADHDRKSTKVSSEGKLGKDVAAPKGKTRIHTTIEHQKKIL